ncbi:MAG: hypothetical protein U9R34_02555 [Nanoarchaeota archaeon]|nr:hypothetical protein [Nanoarchaeota archaeon]
MRNLRKSKKGFGWGPIIQMILGAIVIALVVLAINKPLLAATKSFFAKEELKLKLPGEEGFVPFTPQYTTEEQTVVDSMNGLIMAINSIATNTRVDKYSENKIEAEKVAFKSYKIAFSTHLEIEEDGLNDFRDWAFEKEFEIKSDAEGNIVRQGDHKIFADYIYGSCTNDNERDLIFGDSRGWVDCNSKLPKTSKDDGDCYCTDEDDNTGFEELNDLKIREDLIKKAEKINLAPVRDIKPVYNIVLTTYDEQGNEICRAGTWEVKDKITDKSVNDLLVWGSHKSVCSPDGCDRDGDGIWGSYGPELYGKDWWETLPPGFDKSRIPPEKIDQYFPNRKIQAIEDNGEGCLDSPTWVECPGIKIYYCGKYGSETGAGSEFDYYYNIDSDGDIHNRAGIKVLWDIDSNYTGCIKDDAACLKDGGKKGYSSANREYSDTIAMRDSDAKKLGDFLVGSEEYAKSYDLGMLALAVAKPLLTGNVLEMRKINDPTVFCYDGKRIGTSATTVKCDPDFGGCAVCNFEMSQNITKDYSSALSYIAGYGDPKYVMYYEAFPAGEEEAWALDELSVGLYSIAAWNLAAQALPLGGPVLAKIKGLSKYLRKSILVPSIITRIVKGGFKPIAWFGKKSKEQIEKLGNEVSNAIRSTIKKGTNDVVEKEAAERLLKKTFENGYNILHYAKPEDIKQIASLEEVAEWVVKNDEKQLEALAKHLGDKEIVSKYDIFKGKLSSNILQKGPKYAIAYGVALSMAKEDSMNQKFLPIGVNAIGAKEPYKGALTTGSGLDKLNSNVAKYYIQLTRDRYKGGIITGTLLDQNAQRFFLASPCKADLAVVLTECQCWQSKEESEKLNDNMAKAFGNISVLNHTINTDFGKDNIKRYEKAVKVCRDRTAGFGAITLESPIQKTECIVVNPILREGTFCYSGSHSIAEVAKYGVVAGTIAASIAGEAALTAATIGTLGAAAPMAKFVSFAYNTGIDVAGASITNKISKTQKWPNH